VLSGFVPIPDSVELLSFHGSARPSRKRTLTFGSGSRLAKISAASDAALIDPTKGFLCQSFLQISTWSLKLFRSSLEFA
jgi:hypothetical protein